VHNWDLARVLVSVMMAGWVSTYCGMRAARTQRASIASLGTIIAIALIFSATVLMTHQPNGFTEKVCDPKTATIIWIDAEESWKCIPLDKMG
jgi:hypothetical protein